jgi:hypothetical protein
VAVDGLCPKSVADKGDGNQNVACMKLRTLLLAFFLLPLALFAAPAEPLIVGIMRDLSARDARPLADVTYVVTEDSGNNNYVYRVKRIGAWQTQHTLLLNNGWPSSEKGMLSFARDRNNNTGEYPTGGEIRDRWLNLRQLAALVQPSTLTVATTPTGQSVYMSFTCKASVAGSEPAELKGTLVYDTKLGIVTSMQFVNKEPIKTSRGKIEKLTETLTFEKDSKLGVPVPSSIRWSVKGRKGMMGSFEDSFSASFSDYTK